MSDFVIGYWDDEITAVAVTASSAGEAITRARRLAGEYTEPEWFVLRSRGRRLYRVQSEIEARIEGGDEDGNPCWVPCTSRSKSAEEFWVFDIVRMRLLDASRETVRR